MRIVVAVIIAIIVIYLIGSFFDISISVREIKTIKKTIHRLRRKKKKRLL